MSFIIGCNLATTPCLKTTVIATAPVAIGWFIFLWMLPRQFRDFATSYIRTHPECEESAREKQCALQAQLQQVAASAAASAAAQQQQPQQQQSGN
jgi:hypothetical protein